MSGPLVSYDAHGACTWYHYIIGCPRVILVPVVSDVDPEDSNTPVKVEGFAVFVLEESVAGGGTENEVVATFVKTVVPGDGSPEMTATIHDYGAYGVRLSQ